MVGTRITLAPAILAAFVGGLLVFSTGGSAEPASFVETFDGDPAVPTPMYDALPWAINISTNDDDPWGAHPMAFAQHGDGCSPPPALHYKDTFEGTFYQCRDHVMTAMTNDGYDYIYLSPPALVDFSAGEAVVRWDQSTLITSNREWTNFWLIPWDDNLALPTVSQFNMGLPRNGVAYGRGVIHVVRDFDDEEINNLCCSGINDGPRKAGLEPSPTRRDTFEIRIRRGGMTVGMPDYDHIIEEAEFSPALAWDRAVFVMTHQSYNPKKGSAPDSSDCALVGMEGTCPEGNTWHWDNVEISPSVPISIGKTGRVLETGEPATIAPAPPKTWLRAHRAEDGVELSFDGGITWEPAIVQDRSHADRAGSTWHPVPEGATTIAVRGVDFLLDPQLWSLGEIDVTMGLTGIDMPATTATAAPKPAPAAEAPSALPATGARSQPEPGLPWSILGAGLGALLLAAGGLYVVRIRRA